VRERIRDRIKEKSRLTKDEWREYTKTVWQIANVTNPDHPAVFPLEIPSRLIKLFSFIGETVLDPFAGVGTTAKAALALGRKAICIEQNEHYVSRIHNDLGLLAGNNNLAVVEGDSRNVGFLSDNSIDLVVTSPPYWNKADYGGDGANVGNIGGYKQFFRAIKPTFEECLRVLRPGRKLCVVTANVNQHTEHGLLTFPLAADFLLLLRDLGFLLVNEIIWSKDGTGGRWGSWGSQRPIFGSYPYPPNFLFKNVHEYILVMAKPSEHRVRGPKVVLYRSLMELGDT
jgi:DNA modification methylase